MNTMIRFSPCIKVLAIVLSVLIVLLGLPLSVFAEDLQALFVDETDGNSAPAIDVTAEASEHSFEPFEETSLRSDSTKTFRLPDGSHYLAQYTTDVHNTDADGNYQDIDNSLKLTDGVFSTPDKRFSLAGKAEKNVTLLRRSFGDASLSFSVKNARSAAGAVEKNTVCLPEDASVLDRLTTLPDITSAVLYEDVWENTDLRYVLSGNDVSEYIIINAPAESYEYAFAITAEGLAAKTEDSGEIVFTDAETGEFVCRIPAPVMWDAERNVPEKINTVITEETGENGKTVLLVTYTADAAWMNAPERKFPVTLDPPVIANRSTGVTDLDILTTSPTRSVPNDTSLYVSSTWRTYWKLNTLPSLPLLARITDATISFFGYDGQEEAGGYLGVFDVLTDWDSTLTWGKVSNAANPQGKPASVCTDYLKCPTDATPCIWSEDYYVFHILPLVNKWYDGVNYGLMLMPAQNNIYSGHIGLCSSENSVSMARPALTVTYLDMKGTEDYWSFASQSAGQAGTGYINNATGNLVFSIPTLTTTDSLLPVTPTLVYNYNMQFADYCYPNVQSANRYSHTAKSFRLNLNETVIKKAFTDLEGLTVYYYIWTDGDGTEHYFLYHGDGTYADEDGLLLILQEQGSGVTITDSGRTMRIFSACSHTLSGVTGAWYLSSITDRYGNRVEFTVDNSAQSNRITEIWLYPNGESGILQMKLLYNSAGKLCCVFNPHTGEGVVFRYANTYGGAVGTGYGNYLKQTVRAHGGTSEAAWRAFYNTNSNSASNGITMDATADYTYNYLGLMNGILDGFSGRRLTYYTYSTPRIAGVLEAVTASGVQGQELDYTYLTDATVIQTAGTDDLLFTSDDIRTFYTFDRAARCVSTYSTDLDGNMVYGLSTAEYVDGEENPKAKNGIKQSATVSDIAANLLRNPAFLGDGTLSIDGWDTGGSVTVAPYSQIFNRTEDGLEYALRLAESTGRTYISQDVILQEGTYTFSADMRTDADTSGMTVRLVITDNSAGEVLKEQRVVFPSYATTPQNLCPSVTFSVSGEDTDIGVKVEISGVSSPVWNHAVRLRQASLTKSLGTGLFSLVDFGGFERSSWYNEPEDKWSNVYGGNSIVTSEGPDGNCLKMTGSGVGSINRCTQPLFEADEEAYFDYLDRPLAYRLSPKQYRFSAAARAEGALPGSRSTFEAGILVTFYDMDYMLTEYSEYYPFRFCRDTEAWQYVCGTFTVPDGCFVERVEIVLDYSNQAGAAWFDDVSFCFVGVDEGVNYCTYNPSGTVRTSVSGYSATWYRYANESGQRQYIAGNGAGYTDAELAQVVTAVIGPRYATVYRYDSSLEVTEERKYSFSRQRNTDYNGFDETTATLLGTVSYTRNAYGQVTQTLTSSGGSTVRTSTEYLTDAEESEYLFLFGAVSTEYDDLRKGTKYFYEEDSGRLAAVLGPDGKGICYDYDEHGRPETVREAQEDGTSFEPCGTAQVVYGYDGDNLGSIHTPTAEYVMDYDAFGNRTMVGVDSENMLRELASYEYNPRNGKLRRVNYGNGQSVRYVYDALDRVSKIQYNTNGGSVFATAYEYTYDAAGNIYCVKDNILGTETYAATDSGGRSVGYATSVPDEMHAGQRHGYRQTFFLDDDGRMDSSRSWLEYNAGTAALKLGVEAFCLYDTITGNLYSYGQTFYNGGEILEDEYENSVSYGTYYQFDELQRVTHAFTSLTDNFSSGVFQIRSDYGYAVPSRNGEGNTSTRISSVTTQCGNAPAEGYTYTYDDNGNITHIRLNGTLVCSYVYDSLGQLIRENNTQVKTGGQGGTTFKYDYDAAGNITKKRVYAYTTGTLPANSLDEINYSYGDNTWEDLLTEYDGTEIEYDEIGNPIQIGEYTLEWSQGRRLDRYYVDGAESIEFTYNADGIRTSKTLDGDVTHYYLLDGSTILSEEWIDGGDQHLMVYVYDANGSPIGYRYRNSYYSEGEFDSFLYKKNLQGDILGIYGADGTCYATYVYDAWGNFTVTYTNCGNNFANAPGVQYNPFTYRGYYYDVETGLYYLNSRYYNPAWGRFLNADCYLNANGDILGFNMFAYCGNNPVMGYDPEGTWNWGGFIVGLGIVAATVITVATFGTGSVVGSLVAIAAISTGGAMMEAAAKDSTMVIDLSISVPISSETYGKAGVSIVIDFSENDEGIYGYGHIGGGIGISDGLSYSTGFVENFNEPTDYSKDFWDINAGYYGGIDYCFNPNGQYSKATKAMSVSFGVGYSFGAGYDYYSSPLIMAKWGDD